MHKRLHSEFPLIFRKDSIKISATITFIKNSKNILYFYFGVNSLKRNIANPIAQFILISLLQLSWAVVLVQRDNLSPNVLSLTKGQTQTRTSAHDKRAL